MAQLVAQLTLNQLVPGSSPGTPIFLLNVFGDVCYMRINFGDNSPNFTAKPANMKAYSRAVAEGLEVLDKKVGIIIHNSSVPSAKTNTTGIGSLLSTNARAAFVPFLREQGVTTIQQEPAYLRRLSDPSPYSPISTSKNIYAIPLDVLTTDEYDGFLSSETLKKVQERAAARDDEKVDYAAVAEDYELALREAYDTYSHRTHTLLSDETLMLALDFSSFKKRNIRELEPNAIYESLTKKYNDEDWRNWDEQDRTLYDHGDESPYLKQLREDLRFDVEYHMFKQWIAEREIAKTNKLNEERGIRIIADTPVAFTPAEEWLNKDLFMEDYVLGAPPDYFSAEGQRWGFAVLKPDLIFNEDGSLGKGGEFLRKRYESIFKDSPGGVRIDHVIGLIDPFVYNKNERYMTPAHSGRLYSSPFKEDFAPYAKRNIDEHAAILEKIVFPAAAKYGISKDAIICEDLGEITMPVRAVIDKLKLTGLSVTQFGASGFDAPERNVIMPGSHDNKSFIEYTDEFFANAEHSRQGREHFLYKTHVLGSDTVVPEENVHEYREEMRSDKKKFMVASFAELFTSPAKKVQIFFTDLFGIGKTYNVPGSKKDCWTLRLGSDFEKLYYDNLAQGLGVNFPEVIARAIRQRGTAFAEKHKNLLARLDKFTQILKS